MPRQLVLSRVPVDLSIVEYSMAAGEEIFLTYTWDRKNGPFIVRDGKKPPHMGRLGQMGQKTNRQYGLRLGSWLIQKSMATDEVRDVENLLKDAKQLGQNEDVSIFQQYLKELNDPTRPIKAHDNIFLSKYRKHEIVGQQGCANLTLNPWHVGFVNNILGTNGDDQVPHVLIAKDKERLQETTYSSLVKWKRTRLPFPRLTIEEVKFNDRSNIADGDLNSMVLVQYDDRWIPRADAIEFAVSGQQVIRDGEIVPLNSICHEFTDVRHIIEMPNLNPFLKVDESSPPERRDPPNHRQRDAVWLGEEHFLKNANRNLLRAALCGPVVLDLSDSDMQEINTVMREAGYRESAGLARSLSAGEWRYSYVAPNKTSLEVYFRRNTYGWTMIGLSADRSRILSLATTGIPGKTGYQVEEASEILLRAGATDALLIDQGKNVFQNVMDAEGQLKEVVSAQRRRQRATFIFARER